MAVWRRPVIGCVWFCALIGLAAASEFPERECCDPVYPPPVPTVPSSSAATPTGRSGANIKTAIAILNCLLARQLCFEDVSCSAILEIIPRVCGPELVACSTVTVTKCQAALRTLQAFPFFKPTCLCKEPHVDPECNSFRDFLFDHPCVYVLKKEKDPYPVDALPTCNHALSVCQREEKCIKLYDDFKTNCKVRENKCRMEDRELCHESWTNLRLSPMFGCICPNNHMKRRCDRIFSIVNHNPCVDVLPVSFDLSGTDSALLPYSPDNGYFKNFWFPSSTKSNLYPYFLFPATNRPRGFVHITSNIISPSPSLYHHVFSTHQHHQHHQHHHGTVTGTRHHAKEPPLIATQDVIVTVTRLSGGSADVKMISSSKNSSATFSYEVEFEPHLKNPLVDPSEGEHEGPRDILGIDRSRNTSVPGWRTHHDFRPRAKSAALARWRPDSPRNYRCYNYFYSFVSDQIIKYSRDLCPSDMVTFQFRSTCHEALENCDRDPGCHQALMPVLRHCDATRCDRGACMEALQGLYKDPRKPWSLEIAFCLCKKTDSKQDRCMMAQEKLHPVCAQRIERAPTPTCHSLAEVCRRDKECIIRLEYYEQSCAVDTVTKKCAGPPSECRVALLGILGTELRTSCACKGTDFTQLYECLGWQRLLWVNPCVVESQKDYHLKRAAMELALQTTTTPSTTTVTKATTMQPWRPIPVLTTGPEPLVVTTETATEPKTTESTTLLPTTTTTMMPTTIAPRYCVVQRPHKSDQYIKEGKSKRLYREDELECSELCQCGRGESLVCHTICVDRIPCKTDFAFYNHAAPAYQAFRGRCLCYSGQFICMRPAPGDYHLPQGVFLFLGYSERDEQLLRPHSNLTVRDAVISLQDFIVHEVDNQTSCQLSLFNITQANIILAAKLSDDNGFSDDASILAKEQEECGSILEEISEKVNSQHPEFNSHLLLSIFKMAEVEIVQAQLNTSPMMSSVPFSLLLSLNIAIYFIRKYYFLHIKL